MSEQPTKDQISTGAGQGADAATAATEPVRRPGPLPSNTLLSRCLEVVQERLDDARNTLESYRGYPLRERRYQRHVEDLETLILDINGASGEPPQASNSLLDTWNAWLKDAESLIESGVATDMIAVCPLALRRLCTEAIARAAHEPPAAPAAVETFSFDGEGIYQMFGMTGEYVRTEAYRDAYAALQATKAERDRWWNAAQDRASQPPRPSLIAICTAYESGFGHGAAGDGLPNPYRQGTEAFEAYQIGVDAGYAEGKRGAAVTKESAR